MGQRFPFGGQVYLKDPLPQETRGPWKVVGIDPNKAPPRYKILAAVKGKTRIIQADEGELFIPEVN